MVDRSTSSTTLLPTCSRTSSRRSLLATAVSDRLATRAPFRDRPADTAICAGDRSLEPGAHALARAGREAPAQGPLILYGFVLAGVQNIIVSHWDLLADFALLFTR
jgi:hypothetical protein